MVSVFASSAIDRGLEPLLGINYVGLWFLAQQDVIYIVDVSVIGIRN
jgi:hypothetical protein